MKQEFKMRAARARISMGSNKIELYAYQTGDGGGYVAEELSMKSHNACEFAPPFCTLTNAEAQILIDDLWSAGLRPSEGSGSAGSLKATQGHLADMKTILFHKLGIK